MSSAPSNICSTKPINLLCNGTLALIRHADQWAKLKQDAAGAARLATEECLRYDSPVKSIQRIASEDVEMRGKVAKRHPSPNGQLA